MQFSQTTKNKYNDNDIVKLNKTNNDNVSSKEVDLIADYLVEEFASPDSRRFYCKVAWKLPRTTIQRLVDKVSAAENVKNPGGLFHYLAEQEL